jgi:hypothetical protein
LDGGGGPDDAGTASDATPPPTDATVEAGIAGPFAYGIVIAPDGTWEGIENPDAEVAALVASGAKYIRISRAAPSTSNVGIPNSTEAPFLQKLIQANLSLGAVILAQDIFTKASYADAIAAVRREGERGAGCPLAQGALVH